MGKSQQRKGAAGERELADFIFEMKRNAQREQGRIPTFFRKNRGYFEALEKKAEEMAHRYGCRFVDNETPYERVPQGHPTIVDYFYHEEVRGSQNTGVRNKKEEN